MALAYGYDPLTAQPLDRNQLLDVAIRSKQKQTTTSLQHTNDTRIPHLYQPDDFVYLKNHKPRKTAPRYQGPFKIISVRPENNTLRIDCHDHHQTVNFRHVKPFLGEGRILNNQD
jgi:hypothetical protein